MFSLFKQNQKNTAYLFIQSFVFFLLVFSRTTCLYSQESDSAEYYNTRIKLEYIKQSDDSKILRATISALIDRKPTPVGNLELSFFDETDSSLFLGQTNTDSKGVASFVLNSGYPIGKDTTKSLFSVSFDGDEKYGPSDQEIQIRDAKISTNYDIIDSVYTVTVTANEVINGELASPLTEMDVYAYVQRLFSQLKVGEGWLEDGVATIEIPQNLPGDENKNLKIIVKIPESEIYGTVENETSVAWGVEDSAIIKHHKEKRRALWKPMAPLWMVITLSILITGVFFHYIWIISKLFRIKKYNRIS